jgi:succinate dehydrogenase / fumarate reductase cytochrome b subunit
MASSSLLGSSLAKKYWMALTGLFLCVFLVAHLAGNLQLLDLSQAGQEKFNEYAKFMTTFPLVKIVSYLLYASILFHAIDGIYLAVQNRKARPVRYAHEKAGANSNWYARQMALLGTLLLVFIIIHMKSFWYEMHFGSIGSDGNGNKDLATITIAAFQQWWYVAFYVLSMLVLAFHLLHGFKSAFQTLGINHPRYNKSIHTVGMFFGVFIPILFALIPVWVFLKA